MDALHLPRLHASSILPAWRRAWRRKPVDGFVPLPAPLGVDQAPLRAATCPPAQAARAAQGLRLAGPQSARLDDACPPAPARQPVPSMERPATQPRLRVRQDPADARRVRLAGSMAEVCAALDRLVLWQESDPR